jgi:hypothetical protein
MNEHPTTTIPAAAAPPSPAPADTSGHIDPADYQAAVERAAQFDALVTQLSPYAEKIKLLVDNPEYGEVADNAWSAYNDMREKQKPKIAPELAPLAEDIGVIRKMADTLAKERQEAAEAPQRAWQNKWTAWQNDPANDRMYKKLLTDHPDLEAGDFRRMAELAAAKDFAPLATVWNENSWRFVKDARPSPPPSSLRTDAGDVGIPGPSSEPATKAENPQEAMRQRIIDLERASRRIA